MKLPQKTPFFVSEAGKTAFGKRAVPPLLCSVISVKLETVACKAKQFKDRTIITGGAHLHQRFPEKIAAFSSSGGPPEQVGGRLVDEFKTACGIKQLADIAQRGKFCIEDHRLEDEPAGCFGPEFLIVPGEIFFGDLTGFGRRCGCKDFFIGPGISFDPVGTGKLLSLMEMLCRFPDTLVMYYGIRGIA